MKRMSTSFKLEEEKMLSVMICVQSIAIVESGTGKQLARWKWWSATMLLQLLRQVWCSSDWWQLSLQSAGQNYDSALVLKMHLKVFSALQQRRLMIWLHRFEGAGRLSLQCNSKWRLARNVFDKHHKKEDAENEEVLRAWRWENSFIPVRSGDEEEKRFHPSVQRRMMVCLQCIAHDEFDTGNHQVRGGHDDLLQCSCNSDLTEQTGYHTSTTAIED